MGKTGVFRRSREIYEEKTNLTFPLSFVNFHFSIVILQYPNVINFSYCHIWY